MLFVLMCGFWFLEYIYILFVVFVLYVLFEGFFGLGWVLFYVCRCWYGWIPFWVYGVLSLLICFWCVLLEY